MKLTEIADNSGSRKKRMRVGRGSGSGKGKQADQSEVNAAVGRSTRFLLPGMIFLFTINIPSALSLYWLTGGIVAFIQQAIVLNKDEEEMEAIADKPSKKDVAAIPEAESIFERNMATLETLGPQGWAAVKKSWEDDAAAEFGG